MWTLKVTAQQQDFIMIMNLYTHLMEQCAFNVDVVTIGLKNMKIRNHKGEII